VVPEDKENQEDVGLMTEKIGQDSR